MEQVPLQQFRCTSCLDRNFHYSAPTLYQGIMLQPGECYCFGTKKPRKFKKTESKKAPPAWCPLRKRNVELAVFDFEDGTARQMFAFLYDYCGAMCTDTCRYQITGHHTVAFSAQDFWAADDKDALLGDIQVPNFGILCFDDGLRKQYFFKENGVYVYQPYMRESKKAEGDAES